MKQKIFFFVIAFVVLSILPLVYQKFELTGLGFPFIYFRQSVYGVQLGDGLSMSFQPVNFLYDLFVAGILVTLFYMVRYRTR